MATTPTKPSKKTMLRCLTCTPALSRLALPSLRFRRRDRHGEFRSVRAVFWPLVSMRLSSSESTSDTTTTTARHDSATAAAYQGPLPSPVTPSYVHVARIRRPEAAAAGGGCDAGDQEEEEEACRRFEKCLVEMVVEEGRVGDLADVEELTRWWGSLTSPVFVDMVRGFYCELCKDLFPTSAAGDGGCAAANVGGAGAS